jgi:hypothetical protein
MGFDDGPADRQPYPHPAGLGGVERLENALEVLRIDPWPGIAHRDEDAISVGLLGTDQQLSRLRLDRAHGFDCIQHQVQQNLLQLYTIPVHGNQSLRKARLDRDSILGDRVSRQYDHLTDRVIEVKAGVSRRRFPDVITDAVDDLSGSIGIANDGGKRFPDLVQLGGRRPRKFITARALLRTLAIGWLISCQGGGLLAHDA